MGGPARGGPRASPYTARHLPGRQAHQHPAADRHSLPRPGPDQGLGRGGEHGREPRQSRRGEYRTRHPVLERAAGDGRAVARVRRSDGWHGAREAAPGVQSRWSADRDLPRYRRRGRRERRGQPRARAGRVRGASLPGRTARAQRASHRLDHHVGLRGTPSADRLRADPLTAGAPGGSTDQATVVLRGVLADLDAADSLRLEVELRPVGTAFTRVPTQLGGRVANGQNGFVAVPGLTNNTGYHWQARTADQTGRASGWTTFGGNAETAPDFSTSIEVPPAAPTALGQFQGDNTTPIPAGGTATGRSVIFKPGVTDPNPADQLHLEVEVQTTGVAFTAKANGFTEAPVA